MSVLKDRHGECFDLWVTEAAGTFHLTLKVWAPCLAWPFTLIGSGEFRRCFWYSVTYISLLLYIKPLWVQTTVLKTILWATSTAFSKERFYSRALRDFIWCRQETHPFFMSLIVNWHQICFQSAASKVVWSCLWIQVLSLIPAMAELDGNTPTPWFSANVSPAVFLTNPSAWAQLSVRLCHRAEQWPHSGRFLSDCTRLDQTISRHKCFVQRPLGCDVPCPAVAVLPSALLLLPLCSSSLYKMLDYQGALNHYLQFSSFGFEIQCCLGQDIPDRSQFLWV